MIEPLEAGYRVGVAPNFAVRTDWPARLAVNSGSEPSGAVVVPKPDWRPVGAAELALLTAPGPTASQVSLFHLSDELRARWWKTAEALGMAGDSDAYPAYAREVVEYLRAQGLPAPADTAAEAVVTAPDRRTTRDGLDGSVDVRRGGGLIAGVNLGDEPTAVVFLNLPPAAMRAKTPAQDRWLAKTFLAAHPDYPLVKVRLDPGEGYWLPAAGAVFDHWTLGQNEVGVLIVLRTLTG